jgi:hypothetical protein
MNGSAEMKQISLNLRQSVEKISENKVEEVKGSAKK